MNFILIALFILINNLSFAANIPKMQVKVIKVADGDTITVEWMKLTEEQKRSGFFQSKEKVRLIGVDAPEKKQPIWGEKSLQFLKNKLLNKMVSIESDVRPRDQYGRMLAYVYLDTELVNETIIKEGLGMVYTIPPNVAKVDLLTRAQEFAKTNKSGIWSSESPLAEIPSEYRKRSRKNRNRN
jgi:micrococcal nuclease